MKKKVSAAVAVLGLTAVLALTAFAVTAGADPGATVYQQCPTPTGHNDQVTNLPNCEFQYPDGNGNWTTYVPTGFHEVVTPSGNENEVIVGTVANGTGQTVTYGPGSGYSPTCLSFAEDNRLPDYELTILPSGSFTLTCHN